MWSDPAHCILPNQNKTYHVPLQNALSRAKHRHVSFFSPSCYKKTRQILFYLVYSDFIPEIRAKQRVPFPRHSCTKALKNTILNFFSTKHLTNRFLYTIFESSKGKNLMTRCENICGDQRFRLPPTFSLLWTLGPKI